MRAGAAGGARSWRIGVHVSGGNSRHGGGGGGLMAVRLPPALLLLPLPAHQQPQQQQQPQAHPALALQSGQRRSSSSTASASSSSSSTPGGGVCPTVLIKRQFLLQVHPDFFTQFAKERAINGENLKLLNAILEPASSSRLPPLFPTTTAAASPRNLTFYLKPPPPSPNAPARVVVPLDRDRGRVLNSLRDILQAHCKGLALPALPPVLFTPAAAPQHAQSQSHDYYQHHQQQQQQGYNKYGDAWARARANARRRRRGWQEWRAGADGMGDEAEGGEEEDDDDERPPPFLDLWLEAAGRREGKWGTMQARRAAAVEVGRQVAALKAQWGFEEIELRVDWAAEFLLVTLRRLDGALREFYDGREFRGLDLVVMQHDIVRDTALDAGEGRLLLCPSDPPLRWAAALEAATPQTLRRAQALRRKEAALVRAVQNLALPGAVVERGLTCSRRQYRAFLRRCLRPHEHHTDDEEDDDDDGYGEDEEVLFSNSGAGLPSCPWEGLRLRVERGVRPRVLESGALQVDAPRVRSHACLQALAGRWAEGAQAAAARHHEAGARLRDLQHWCQHPGSGLGLTSIGRDAAVSVEEASHCLERLLSLPGDHPVRAALRGAAVGGRVVVVKAGYGWTREGALRLPWDWDLARRG